MTDVTVSWTLPTTREQGGALPVSEIKHVIVSLSVDGVNFAEADQVAPPATDVELIDVDFGDWVVRLVVVDTNNVAGAAVDTPFTVLDTSPPGVVTNVLVTFN